MRAIVLAALAVAATGCASAQWTPPPVPTTTPYSLTEAQTKAIEDAVRYQMKDPASSTFRNVRAVQRTDGQVAVCGEVNSKNSFGGYGGFSPFYGSLKGQTPVGISVGYDAQSSNIIAKNCGFIGATR